MTKTALSIALTLAVFCATAPADAGQTASGTQAAQPQPAGELPVSLDRIKKALTAPEPSGPPIQKSISPDDEVPRFIVQTQAPRTLMLRSYLDDGTAVPAYVRPAFDPYHYEFLEMVTPDAAKGCAQFSDRGCAELMGSRVASGLVWDQLLSSGVDRVLRRFLQPKP